MDVLELVSGELTNQDIVEGLVVPLGTVKWYTSQIYANSGWTTGCKLSRVPKSWGSCKGPDRLTLQFGKHISIDLD